MNRPLNVDSVIPSIAADCRKRLAQDANRRLLQRLAREADALRDLADANDRRIAEIERGQE